MKKVHNSKIEKKDGRARVVCSCGFTSSWVDLQRIVFDYHLKAFVIV